MRVRKDYTLQVGIIFKDFLKKTYIFCTFVYIFATY